MNDYGAMISFEVEGGLEAGKTIMISQLRSHSTYSPEDLKEAGIDPGLVRLSPGLEDAEDIIEDLREAMDKIK